MKTFFSKNIFLIALIIIAFGCDDIHPWLDPDTDTPPPTDVPDSTVGDWNLVWNDEFDTFDESKWTVVDAPSGINNDLAYLSPDNVTIENGLLRIRTDDSSIGDRNFTGGKVLSKDKFEFTYGRVAVRVRTASTPGTHTAAWLVHTPCDGINPCAGAWPPEIDIIEMIGREPDRVHQTVHYGTTPYDGTTGGRWPDWEFDVTTTVLPDDQLPGEAFHEYVMEWEEDVIRWYIDGSLTKTWTANDTDSFMPREAMYLILDVVVGGDWAQAPTDASVWPQTAEFDYVRVYKKDSTAVTDPPLPPTTTTYRIKNAASGRYLTADGTDEEWVTLYQADLDTSYTTQRWVATEVEEGFYSLAPEWPQNRALTSDGQETDAPVYQAAYQGWTTQKWKIEEAEGGVRLVPQWPENVTLTTSSNDNWSAIRQTAPTGADQERWSLEEVE